MSTTRKIRCTDCGEAVPYGRLSCPSCGTLLASVAGGVRHAAPAPTDASLPAAPTDISPVAAPTDVTHGTTPTLRPRPPRPSAPRPPAQRTAGALTLVPTSVIRSVTAGAFIPATAGAFAGATAGTVEAAGTPAAAGSATAGADAATMPPAAAASSHRLAIGLDRERIDAGLEWAAALGAGIIAIAMLLPWSRSVIGSSGIGYFDSWGLAGPGHVLVLAWALVVLALAVVPTKVPMWISRGIAALALGVFALGLTWPYAFGPLGGQIGVVLTLIGSIVLVVTGVAADWHTRHDAGNPPV